MTSAPPAIRVAVNDRQLGVAAVMEHGRVLVPFRAVVEALGGRVDAFHLPLPPPSRIIAGRTYAPIRYLAGVVHAQIQYDGTAHLVQVFTQQTVASETTSATPTPRPPNSRTPADGTRVGSAYPTISTSLPIAAGRSIARLSMSVDGIDVSPYARYAGQYVTYIPRDGLSVGSHNVAISGVDSGGLPFNDSWSFETTQSPASNIGSYSNLTPIQLHVYTSEVTGGAPISVDLTAPPGGQAFAFVCTSEERFPLYAAPSSQFYSASIPTRDVGSAVECPVTAMYIAWNGAVSYAAYPAFVHLLPHAAPAPSAAPTQVPRPTPVATRTPAPIAPRTPEPTPAPRVKPPTPIARPTPSPAPADTPTPRPKRTRPPHPIDGDTPSPNTSDT